MNQEARKTKENQLPHCSNGNTRVESTDHGLDSPMDGRDPLLVEFDSVAGMIRRIATINGRKIEHDRESAVAHCAVGLWFFAQRISEQQYQKDLYSYATLFSQLPEICGPRTQEIADSLVIGKATG